MKIAANKIKKLEEKTPDVLKKLFAPIIRNKVIKNKVFLNQYQQLTEFELKTDEEKRQIHFNLLKKKMIQAYEHTDYYKKIFDEISFDPYKFTNLEEINLIPSVNKEIVLANFNLFVNHDLRNYYTAFTGGSTGKPMKIYLDGESPFIERAFVYKYWEKTLGYSFKSSRVATFRGLEFNNMLYKLNPIDNQIVMSPFKLSKDTLSDYVKIINQFKPEYFHGYPSALTHFCLLLENANIVLKSPIKGVFLVSENLLDQEREIIERVLQCQTSIFYGHSERLIFAENTWDKGYNFHPLYGHVELLHYEENYYKIKATGLLNNSMILINYMPDDLIEICKDGRLLIHGHHEKEFLLGRNNEKISMSAINFHNDIFKKIQRYQFEQFRAGEVVFKIEINDNELLYDADLIKIKETLDKKLKKIIDYDIDIVKKIPLTSRGKFNKIIQHITETEVSKL